jgi:uncharacterized protein (DUF58 family)
MSVGFDMVLDTREFRLLEGLRLAPRRSFSGRVRGERLSKKKGISIEFADYREYGEGDDLRHLDWNVLARLETPVIKTYQDEEDLAVYLLLDASASMEFGDPSKIEAACRICCALGYVALCGLDAVFPRAVGRREQPVPAMRSRSAYPRLASWARDVAPDGGKSLAQGLRDFALSGARAGLAFVVSDGLDPDVFAALRIVAGRGHEIGFVQVLSEEDFDPEIEGDIRLVDAENGPPVEVTAGGNVLRGYKQRLNEHNSKIASECLRLGGRYVQTTVVEPLEALFTQKLRREGWVAR